MYFGSAVLISIPIDELWWNMFTACMCTHSTYKKRPETAENELFLHHVDEISLIMNNVSSIINDISWIVNDTSWIVNVIPWIIDDVSWISNENHE